MARIPRATSLSGIYHVMLRGVNKQRIFENTEDYYAIFRILHFVQTTDTDRKPVDAPNFFLYAYCIMDNHIHLLIQPNGHQLGEVMKRVMTTYAIYFNNTYERIGHLFQDRFKSEPVDDQKYFFTLLQYIHLNPVEAGICSRPSLYLYSSFWEFLTRGSVPDVRSSVSAAQIKQGPEALLRFPELSSPDDMDKEDKLAAAEGRQPKSMMLLGISPEEIREIVVSLDTTGGKLNLREELEQYVREGKSPFCRFLKTRLNLETAEEANNTIVQTLLEMTGTRSISEFQQLDKRTMRGALALVRDSGVSIRQLSHLTGISFSIIRTSYTDVVEKK